jgi:L-ascorbate metabolism protein UlaG (beta-lactamase superfamily)
LARRLFSGVASFAVSWQHCRETCVLTMLFRILFHVVAAALTAAAWLLPSHIADAQPSKPEMRESCPGLIALRPPAFRQVSLRLAALATDQVRLSYAGHSTFLIESPQSVRIATDYNDYVQVPLPTIATMNRAHDTHFSEYPNPAIPHVLRGWTGSGSPARHDLQVQDVRVRNVPTNIRDWSGGTARHGNSIFIFEVGSLCIAHLGHLHHTLNQQQLDEMGRVDVVLVPVDGSLTLDLEGTMDVLKALKAPLMIPMHYFSLFTLQRFLDRARGESWEVGWADEPSILMSRATLPATPKVLVLPGR